MPFLESFFYTHAQNWTGVSTASTVMNGLPVSAAFLLTRDFSFEALTVILLLGEGWVQPLKI